MSIPNSLSTLNISQEGNTTMTELTATAANAKAQTQAIADLLAAEAQVRTHSDAVSNRLRDHDENYFAKPRPVTNAEASELYAKAAHEEKQVCTVTRQMDYRPWDGAYATAKTLFELYGYSGFGVAMQTMFGTNPPQKISVKISPTETVEVPWGILEVPVPLKAKLYLGASNDPEKGSLFTITAELPKKLEHLAVGLFNRIEKTLQAHSLYKGKAITGAEMPEFLDLSKVNPDHVLYNEDVQEALERELWAGIRRRDLFKKAGRPTRWNVLFAGGYGTGKTLAVSLTALEAVKAGVTFIQARPGQDDLKQVMQTANLYAPAIVAFEDIDRVADPERVDPTEISRLLETFHGMRSKTADVSCICTTNFPENIDAGLLRAGRTQGLFYFGDLDAKALQKLIEIKIGKDKLVDVNYEEVHEACVGYSPAFMDLVIEVSRSYALSRHADHLDTLSTPPSDEEYLRYVVRTEDLKFAALRLRAQYDLQQSAKNQPLPTTIDMMIQKVVQEQINGIGVVDSDGDAMYQLAASVRPGFVSE